MKILIVGASGLVGSHCYNYFTSMGYEVLGTHINYATNKTIYFNPSVSTIEDNDAINKFNPQVIIHCGALTNVDYCEINEDESYISTVLSTQNIVKYCRERDVKLIYLSTDYVFDGFSGPYTENSIVNPINVYGKHKLLSESLVYELDDYIIARITNVYGEEDRGKNFVERLLIWLHSDEEKTLRLPNDQFATPVYAADIARMLFLLLRDNKKGIYNLASTDYVTRIQLAKKVKSYFSDNTSVQLQSIDTKSLAQPAQRPLNGGLLNIKFATEYPDFDFTNVDKYILNYLKHKL
jgi:dTDP-4-dehydrorhamnose reductase